MSKGFIKLQRQIMHDKIWQDPLKLRLWLYCCMRSAFSQQEILIDNQTLLLEVGQFVTGRDSLATDFNQDLLSKNRVNARTLWRWIKLLEKEGYLTIKSTNKYSIITVLELQQSPIEQQVSNKCPDNIQRTSTKNNFNKSNKSNKLSKQALLDSLISQELGGELND